MLFIKGIKKDYGYTLLEVLLTLSVLSILSGIAFVSYRNYDLSVTTRDLKLSANAFESRMKNCLLTNGGWEAKRIKKANESCPSGYSESDGGECPPYYPMYPCKVPTSDLKSRLNYVCPEGASCETKWHEKCDGFLKGEDCKTADGKFRYYCFVINKIKHGKNLQVYIRYNYGDAKGKDGHLTGEFIKWCGEGTGPFTLDDSNCRRGMLNKLAHLQKHCTNWSSQSSTGGGSTGGGSTGGGSTGGSSTGGSSTGGSSTGGGSTGGSSTGGGSSGVDPGSN